MDQELNIKTVKTTPVDSRKWFVVYTRAKSEKKACSELLEMGIEAYLPLRKKISQWKDRKKLVEVPLITSYVFVKLIPAERDKVFKCDHIVRYITFEGKPASIPEKQMLQLRCMVNAEIPIEALNVSFKPGENVRIIYGPMAGVLGELIDVENQKRFVLRINNIGYSLVATIPAGWLEKADGQ